MLRILASPLLQAIARISIHDNAPVFITHVFCLQIGGNKFRAILRVAIHYNSHVLSNNH